MLLDEVGAYLASVTPFSLHNDLFLGTTLDSPDTQIGLLEGAGGDPVRAFGEILYERVAIQVLSRSPSYVTARNNAEKIRRALETGEMTLSGTRYLKSDGKQSPWETGRDEKGRHLISVNFEIWKELSPSP